MSTKPQTLLQPKARGENQAVFDEQWQAEALAMADLLIQRGLFDAGDWAAALGEQLAQHQSDDNDTIEAYYQAVLAALQQLLGQQTLLPSDEIKQREEAWKAAYLATPHGQPVVLNIN